MTVQNLRWTNPSLPQTLQIAVWLFYIDAAFDLLLGGGTPILLILGLLSIGSGLGLANERRWGYALALATAGLRTLPLALVLVNDLSALVSLGTIFAIARFALLLHPQSRQYFRVYFR